MTSPILAQKLGAADIAWLRMESPRNPMTIVGLMVFREPMSFGELKRLLEERLLIFARFRQRINAAGTTWVTDPAFEVDAHVHRIGLPPPGDQAALEELVGDLMSTPLDLSRPPWQFHHIEEFDGGSVAIVRLHHAIGDGIALVHVLLSMADEYFDDFDTTHIPSYGQPVRDAGVLEQILRPVGRTVTNVGKVTGEVVGGTLGLIQRPGKLFDWAKSGLSVGAAASKIALLAPDTDTRFKGEVGVSKRVAWSRALPLDDVKAVCEATGAKVNDVLLSSVAGGLRRYFEAIGDPVDDVEIGTVIPVNIRPLSQAFELGNQFGIVFLSLPVGIDSAPGRLHEVRRRMEQLKASAEPAVAFGILQAIGAGPTMLHKQVVDILSSKSSAVMTNVPGPPEELHMGGVPLSHLMFWVPRAGEIGLGVSIISYNGSVRLGVATDARMVPDPSQIIAGLHREFEALATAFSPKRSAKRPSRRS